MTDAVEGLILVNIDTLVDGEPRNNFLDRALTWNEGGILRGARHITTGGHYVYVIADAGLVVLDLDEPLAPKVARVVPLNDGRASHLQFRYLFVTDKDGLKVVDVTRPEDAFVVADNTIEMRDAQGLFVTRTWVYVAGGTEGLVVVDALKIDGKDTTPVQKTTTDIFGRACRLAVGTEQCKADPERDRKAAEAHAIALASDGCL